MSASKDLPLVYATRELPATGMKVLEDSGKVQLSTWSDSIEPQPREAMLSKIKDAEGLLTLLSDRVDADLLDHAPNLKIISQYAVGYNNIDVAECTKRGIAVTNTPGVLTNAVTELALGLLLAVTRRTSTLDRWLRAGQWKVDWHPECKGLGSPSDEDGLGIDVKGGTLGIVGMGNIAQDLALRSLCGLQPGKVIYSARSAKTEFEERFRSVGKAFGGDVAECSIERKEIDDLCKEADFIVVLCSLNPSTVKLINADRLAMMKKNAVIVNVARGPVIDEAALTETLKQKKIFGAGLDVFEKEPVSMSSELLGLDNVVVLPHVASGSRKARDDMSLLVANDQIAFWNGDRPTNLVNPEVFNS